MKNSVFFIIILGLVLGSCEKKPERIELSRIPGDYDSYAHVFHRNDSMWFSNSYIPQDYFSTREGMSCKIKTEGEDRYIISFPTINPFLPENLQLKITRIEESESGLFHAYIMVVENDIYKDTILPFSYSPEVNCFWHNNFSSSIHFNLILKSKVEDNLILDLWGTKH